MLIVDTLVELFVDASRYFSAGDYLGTAGAGGLALGILAAIFLAGFVVFWLCFNRNFYSENKTAKAKVVKTLFVPEHGGTHFSPVLVGGRFGTVVNSDYEEEKDLVVLKCEGIGRLELDNAELLESVEKGDDVVLTYQEKYTYWAWNSLEKTFDDYVPVSVRTKDGTEVELG